MNIKKKLAETKDKIKENRTEIIAFASAGATVIASVTYALISQSKLKKAYAANERILRRNETVGHESVWIADETRQEIKNGSKDVWFDVDGDRFDLILHSDED